VGGSGPFRRASLCVVCSAARIEWLVARVSIPPSMHTKVRCTHHRVAQTVGITLLSGFSNVDLRGTLVVCVECFESKVLFTVPRDAELREVSCAWSEIVRWAGVAPFGGRLYALWARPPDPVFA